MKAGGGHQQAIANHEPLHEPEPRGTLGYPRLVVGDVTRSPHRQGLSRAIFLPRARKTFTQRSMQIEGATGERANPPAQRDAA